MSTTNKRIIIIGGGFAGIQLARKLKNSPYEILLIDQYNYHQFQPLFYQVATARLEPSSVSFPLRKIFHRAKNVKIRITKATGVTTATNTVHTEIGDFTYDYLVLATGCTTNFFGNQQLMKYAYPMKSTTEAVALRNRILQNFEDALSAPASELDGIMNFVVVGGGPTGVELSGALAEMKKNILPKDYPDMDFSKLSIYLLEGSNHTLNNMSEVSKTKSQQYLEDIGVKVWTNSIVQNYDGQTVLLQDGRTIATNNLIWAAGVTGNVVEGIAADSIFRNSRFIVDRHNKVKGYDNVFALGDISLMETPKFPKGHPQVANVAINQAKVLGDNLLALQKGKAMTDFEFKDPGSMATVGKRKAVVDLPGFSFQGRLAWFFWMFLHLMLILSVKSKVIIFINWAWSYFTNDTTLRLILKHKTPPGRPWEAEEVKPI
jgi:NADH dehydrogenase